MSTEIDPRLLIPSEKKPVEQKPTWSKKERRILNLFAVLGLVNMLVYAITQSSFVMQNIYYVYGIVTFVDVLAFLIGLVGWNAFVDKKFHPAMPARFKTYLLVTGLWLISIPVVILAYYQPIIAVNLQDVVNYLWGASLI